MTALNEAKEMIRRILVQEYIDKHPGLQEKDVVMACNNGELVFIHLAEVMADLKIRKMYFDSMTQAKQVFAQLAIHQDERWKDCNTSTRHSRQMVDCLHSSHFNYMENAEWYKQHAFLKDQDELCARKTVMIYEAGKELNGLNMTDAAKRTPRARVLVIKYLKFVIDQLTILHTVLQYEVEIGDLFLKLAQKFLIGAYTQIKTKAAAFDIQELGKVYKALKGSQKITSNDVMAFNEQMLMESKTTLTQAVDEMKSQLQQRRVQVEETWLVISAAKEMVDTMEKLNKDEEISKNSTAKTPKTQLGSNSSLSVNRMSRFIKRNH